MSDATPAPPAPIASPAAPLLTLAIGDDGWATLPEADNLDDGPVRAFVHTGLGLRYFRHPDLPGFGLIDACGLRDDDDDDTPDAVLAAVSADGIRQMAADLQAFAAALDGHDAALADARVRAAAPVMLEVLEAFAALLVSPTASRDDYGLLAVRMAGAIVKARQGVQ